MHQVYAGRRPVVFANTFRAARNLRAAFVLPQRLRRKGLQTGVAFAHHAVQITHRVRLDQGLRQGRWLDQKKPVPVSTRKGVRGLVVHGQRGRNIQQHQPLDRARVIRCKPMRHPRAPVVRQHLKMIKAVVLHHCQRVLRHLAL